MGTELPLRVGGDTCRLKEVVHGHCFSSLATLATDTRLAHGSENNESSNPLLLLFLAPHEMCLALFLIVVPIQASKGF